MKRLLLLLFVLFGFLLPVNSQQRTITGTVTSAEDGQPVAGATVMIKGTTTGTSTDINGKYQISAAPGVVLEFRFLGMTTKEVTVGTSGVVDVALEYELTGVDEVVVVGAQHQLDDFAAHGRVRRTIQDVPRQQHLMQRGRRLDEG